jgi:hypothetical protein
MTRLKGIFLENIKYNLVLVTNCYYSKQITHFVFQYFTIKRHLMKVIPETCSAHKIK